jgi:hypothetical protein
VEFRDLDLVTLNDTVEFCVLYRLDPSNGPLQRPLLGKRGESCQLVRNWECTSQKRDALDDLIFKQEIVLQGNCPSASRGMSDACPKREPQIKNYSAQNNNRECMRKFLLGLIAIAAVLLPLSQNAQAHWGYYHHYYGGYRHAYWHHRYWHGGFWTGGYWHPGYWYPGPVVVVAPY